MCLYTYKCILRFKKFLLLIDWEREREKHRFVVPLIDAFILVCALIRDRTSNVDILGRRSNQPSYLARAVFWDFEVASKMSFLFFHVQMQRRACAHVCARVSRPPEGLNSALQVSQPTAEVVARGCARLGACFLASLAVLWLTSPLSSSGHLPILFLFATVSSGLSPSP